LFVHPSCIKPYDKYRKQMEIAMKCPKFKKAYETAEQYIAHQSIVSCIIL